MRKKSKLGSLIALLLALVVLIALFVVVNNNNKKKEETNETQTQERHIVFSTPKDDIVQLIMQNEAGNYTLNNKDNNWTAQDNNVKLNQNKVQDIIYCFSNFETERTIEGATNLAQYGLDNPKNKATAVLKDGTKKTIFIGNKALDGMSYYTMIENDPKVYVVWNNYGSNLTLELKAMRDISFAMDLDVQNIAYISLSNSKSGKPIEMHVPTNKPDGTYYNYEMTKPYAYTTYVYAKNVDNVLDTMFALQPEDLVDGDAKDLAKYGLDKPVLASTVKDGTGKELTYQFGSKTADNKFAYVKKPNENKVYTIKAEELDALFVKPIDLVSKNAVLVNIEDVKKVEVVNNSTNKNYTLDIQKTVEKTTQNGKEQDISKFTGKFNNKDLDNDNVKKLYQQMLDVIVDGEVDKKVEDKPLVTIKYTLNDNSITTVEFAPYNNDFDAVFVNGKNEFVVNKEKVKTIIDACDNAVK